ncbi:MAG: hypothetical protein Q8928_04520 [Bacteroidota bacterium]|nr:hypothetical protein [Bacteroidota bacterium]
MRRILFLFTLFIILGRVTVNAQETQTVPPPSDKKKIELRPNSRDYGPIKRDNQNRRIERPRNQQMFLKVRPVKRQQILLDNKGMLKNEQKMMRHERRRPLQQRPLQR